MRRIALIAACLLMVTGAWAQKRNVTTSLIELKKSQPDMEKVKTYLEAASQDPSTKGYHKTWYAMGKMYMKMLNMPQYADEKPYAKAADACFKLIDIDPKYEKQDIDNWLTITASVHYQESVKAYNGKDYKTSASLAQRVVDIRNVDGGKRFASNKLFDTTAAAALQIAAYSAYYGKDYANAVKALEALIANPIYNRAGDYSMLSSAYTQSGDNANAIVAIDKGRAAFPENKQLRIDEINYYIKTGQQDVFIKKLQDAVTADPNNAELHFFLAQSYAELANPVDKKGKAKDKPANHVDLMTKADASYAKATTLDPNNVTFLYNFAVFHFNQSVPLNVEMNNLGTTAADDKKYDELNKQVKGLYAKAMPNFQKVYDILEPKHTTINAEDKTTLISCITAMREIHARNNNLDQSTALKAKLKEIRGK